MYDHKTENCYAKFKIISCTSYTVFSLPPGAVYSTWSFLSTPPMCQLQWITDRFMLLLPSLYYCLEFSCVINIIIITNTTTIFSFQSIWPPPHAHTCTHAHTHKTVCKLLSFSLFCSYFLFNLMVSTYSIVAWFQKLCHYLRIMIMIPTQSIALQSGVQRISELLLLFLACLLEQGLITKLSPFQYEL